jgi:hypothetical protein
VSSYFVQWRHARGNHRNRGKTLAVTPLLLPFRAVFGEASSVASGHKETN